MTLSCEPDQQPATYHRVARQAVAALSVRADGRYLDGTFGRGGHSRLLLQQLGPNGQLLGSTRTH